MTNHKNPPAPNTLVLPAEMRWEDGDCLVSCPALPAHTFGENAAQAKAMLIDAVECFICSCRADGTFGNILAKLGYTGDNPLPPIRLDLNGELLDIEYIPYPDPEQIAAYG